MPTPSAAPTRSATTQALVHMLLAGLLGVLTLVVGGPFVVAALFGGLGALLLTLAVGVVVVALLAVVLDRTAGPGALGRDYSAERGVVLGVSGSLTVVVLAWIVVQRDIGESLPIPLRIAPAALPFAALAGLQWPGVVRRVTALVLIVAGAVILVPRSVEVAREDRTALITTEVGTTARPWVTDTEGFQAWVPEVTGSELIWSPYMRADGGSERTFSLFRDDGSMVAPGGDPCALTSWWTPAGDQPSTSCRRIGEERWRRTSDGWQQLVERRDGEWIGVAAERGVSDTLLDEVLGSARRMTDEEYEVFLGSVLPQD